MLMVTISIAFDNDGLFIPKRDIDFLLICIFQNRLFFMLCNQQSIVFDVVKSTIDVMMVIVTSMGNDNNRYCLMINNKSKKR